MMVCCGLTGGNSAQDGHLFFPVLTNVFLPTPKPQRARGNQRFISLLCLHHHQITESAFQSSQSFNNTAPQMDLQSPTVLRRRGRKRRGGVELNGQQEAHFFGSSEVLTLLGSRRGCDAVCGLVLSCSVVVE